MNKVESALSRTTDTKALVIGIETLPRVADMFKELFPGRRALVVADANTWRSLAAEKPGFCSKGNNPEKEIFFAVFALWFCCKEIKKEKI